jgi:hypothetical protein
MMLFTEMYFLWLSVQHLAASIASYHLYGADPGAPERDLTRRRPAARIISLDGYRRRRRLGQRAARA